VRVSADFCMAREFARIRREGPFKTCGKTMLKPLTAARRHTRLPDLGVVRVQGPDAVQFLQGQLSNDVAKLTADRAVLAGLHNPQGRTVAVLRLVQAGPGEILALVPRELAAAVAARLSKFVLRAKVKVGDASAEWDVAGIEAGAIADGLGDAQVGAARRDDEGRLWVCVGRVPARWLVLVPSAQAAGESAQGEPMTRDDWRARDIADGIPQIYAATTEAFVAQMLNLDAVDGIAFDKGCYTGQEVIARAHYRGKVKRRMQRFRTVEPAIFAAGGSGALPDGRSFKVIDAVKLPDGRCEFLAVAPLVIGAIETEDSATPAGTTTAVEQLPLPYSLPD
jgi:tRNA-modifying protein YgfZ